jgi:hypothetical protein
VSTQVTRLAAIPVSVSNPEDWEEISRQLAAETGEPTALALQTIADTLAGAVALLFAADASRNTNLLRGTFTDAVIAQCERNAGCLNGEQPDSVAIKLIGAHLSDGHAALRVRLAIALRDNDQQTLATQFWDLRLQAQVTVGETSCPNCGAPLGQGELICGHCGTDVRSVTSVPLAVSRLELY